MYNPSYRSKKGYLKVFLGSIFMSFFVFAALPITQMIAGGLQKSHVLVDASIVEPPPPPPPIQEPEPEEEPEPEDEPDIEPESQPMSLADLDLDLSGAGLGSLGNGFMDSAGAGLEELSLFDISDLDQTPVPISQPSPRYPNQLKKDKITGSAVVVFVLNEQGRVEDPKLEFASHPDFGKSAMAAIKRWRFKAGQKGGKSVRSNIRQPFMFKI